MRRTLCLCAGVLVVVGGAAAADAQVVQSEQTLVSVLPAGSDSWQQLAPIPSSPPGVSGFTIGFDRQRALVAAWSTMDVDGSQVLVSTRLPPGAAGWDTPVSRGNLIGIFWNAEATIDLDGDAIVAFQTANGASVAIAMLDASAPKLRSLSFRQAGRVGQKLPFAAEPVDIFPVTYRWRFGDGRTATGAHVTHVYRKAGRFRVDLVATDAAGHTALVARMSVRIRR